MKVKLPSASISIRGTQVAGRALSKRMERFSLTINASTTRNDSTVRQYDYKRSDASVVLNYQLGN